MTSISCAASFVTPLNRRSPSASCTLLCVCLLLALFGVAAPVQAGLYPIPNTEVIALPRASNGRDYSLYIGLPASYASSPTRKYPVIYACDGYWDFPLLVAEVGNLSYDQMMPEAIIVGIGYSGVAPDVGALRQIDLTPGTDPYVGSSGSGGADAFLGIIADQIIPYVESHYNVDKTFRVLTGSSYAGLFTVFALFERPGLFQAHIAPSPSLWWRSEYLKTRAREHAASRGPLPGRLFLSWGSEESSSITATTRRMYDELKALKIEGLNFVAREIVGERHAGPKGETFNRGLRYAFAPRAPSPSYALDTGYTARSTFLNLSTRGRVGTGEDVLIAGLVIQGIEAKKILLRAVGPSLVPMGVKGTLANPKLSVVNASKATVASNDNWSTNANAAYIPLAASRAGAFALPANSLDAAVLVTLDPGLYTVVVESGDGTPGVALVEAYEVVP